MPIVHVLLLRDAEIQDPVNADGEKPEPRKFLKDHKYPVGVVDARKLIAAGDAAFSEVPAQDGLPLGCMDASRLEGELRELFPKSPTPPPSQPVPLPEEK